jgi:hypothetical protein
MYSLITLYRLMCASDELSKAFFITSEWLPRTKELYFKDVELVMATPIFTLLIHL